MIIAGSKYVRLRYLMKQYFYKALKHAKIFKYYIK